MGCSDSRNSKSPPPPSFISGGRVSIGGSLKKPKSNNRTSRELSEDESMQKRDPEKKKPNQDRLISSCKTVEITPAHGESCKREIKLYGVCDGHGEFGGEVAQYIATNLPDILFECFANEYMRGLNTVKSLLQESITKIKKGLKSSPVDTQFSGCTVLVCLIFEGTLYTCNLGDSRAVLATSSHSKLVAEALSIDALPSRPSVQQRIKSKGGLVALDTMGHACLVGETPRGKRKFRLGMATSMGDTWATNYGLSHRPDITARPLTSDEMFVVLGSDGIWSVYSNEEIITLCYKGLIEESNVDRVCMQVATMCCEKWAERYERVDDVSMVIALLQDFPHMNKKLKPCDDIELKCMTGDDILDHGTLRSASPQSFMSNTVRWRYVISQNDSDVSVPKMQSRLYLDMDGYDDIDDLSLTSHSDPDGVDPTAPLTLLNLESQISVGAASVSLDFECYSSSSYRSCKSSQYLDVSGLPRSPYSCSRSHLEPPNLENGPNSQSKLLSDLELHAVTPQNSTNQKSTNVPPLDSLHKFSEDYDFSSEESEFAQPLESHE